MAVWLTAVTSMGRPAAASVAVNHSGVSSSGVATAAGASVPSPGVVVSVVVSDTVVRPGSQLGASVPVRRRGDGWSGAERGQTTIWTPVQIGPDPRMRPGRRRGRRCERTERVETMSTTTNPSAFETTSLTDPALYDDPWAFYRWLRTEHPVWFDESTGLHAVSRHADVLTVSRDTEHFSAAQGVRPLNLVPLSIISLDDPEHGKQRRVVARGFT